MRPSTPLLSSADFAAVVSLFGLTYAERTGHLTALASDTVLLGPTSREDTPSATLPTSDAPKAADEARAAISTERRDGPG